MYAKVFEPITVGQLELRNRIVRAAHATGSAWSDDPADLIEYHAARARGGVAMSVLETGGVHRSAATGIPVYADAVMAGYERLTAALRPHGMKIVQQLNHQGSAATNNMLGGAPWSASDIPSPLLGIVPQPMSRAQIDEIVAAFGAAARRAQEGGLDGVEVHAAHGYLIGQFLSPLTNRREDEYGAGAAGRRRFLIEVLAAVRAAVGKSFVVGVRLSADEEIADGSGLGPADMADVARAVSGHVDYVNVSLGSYYRYHKMLAPMDLPLGYEIPKSSVVSQSVAVPAVVTGRIMTIDQAEHVVASGQADLVSMVRALIADPDLVNKTRSGQADRVRPCISSNEGCLGKLVTTGKLGCVVNPAAGNEARVPHDVGDRSGAPQRVLIAGGGPAGLEAARTAALRGHQVTLLEMTRRLGGQVEIAAAAPFRSDIAAITRWLEGEVRRLGVRVLLRTFAEPDTVQRHSPDLVVIATGARPRTDGFQTARPMHSLPGVASPHVFTGWDVLGFGRRLPPCGRAVIYDDVGGFEALSVAEHLITDGTQVTFVTRFATIGAGIPFPPATTGPVRERLAAGGLRVMPDSYLYAIETDGVTVRSTLAETEVAVPADAVVLIGHAVPNAELTAALADLGVRTIVLGDAYCVPSAGHGLQSAIQRAALTMRAV
jgi:2,4-dienoyl-CoA reductase-like NADH-dependent reductase (Old Yellow Enzyme family)